MVSTITPFLIFMEVIFLDIAADTFFSRKKQCSMVRRFYCLSIIFLIMTGIVFVFQQNLPFKIMFNSLTAFMYIFLIYHASIPAALGVLTFHYSIIVSIDFIGLFLYRLSSAEGLLWLNATMFFTKLTEMIIGLLVHKFWKKETNRQVPMEELSILLLSSGIIEFTGVFASSILAKSQTLSRDTMVLVMIIIGLNTFLFLYLLLAARTMMEKSSLRETAREHKRLLDVYKNKQDLYTRQGKRLHEYKNQLLTISSMLDQDQVLEVQDYINKLTGSMVRELDRIHTNHPVADAIMNMKKQEALDKHININFLCSDLKHLTLEDEEIIILLGNLLDNALEAAEQSITEKMIQVQVIQEDKQLVISIKNTCTQPLSVKNGVPESTKFRKEEHGYGIKAIQDIVEKYDGAFAMKQDGAFVKVTAVIPGL